MSRLRKVDVLSADLGDAKNITVKVGNKADDTGLFDKVFWYGAPGYFQMPKAGDNDGCCQAMVDVSGNDVKVVCARDNRLVPKYGTLREGDSCLVGYRDAAIFLKDATDSISLVTKNHASGDKTMMIQLNGQDGHLTITIGGMSGSSMFKMTPDAIFLAVNGGGSLTLDKQGVSLTGNTFNAATGGGNLGVMGPVPPPPGVNSILCGVQGQIGTPSPKWTVA